jgi:hypothetical protein
MPGTSHGGSGSRSISEARRHGIDAGDLGRMYVHVELDPDVRQRVDNRAAAAAPA